MLRRHAWAWIGVLGLASVGCSKKAAPSSASDPEFDKKWAALAEPPSVAEEANAPNPGGLPDQPAITEVQRIIRSNLMAVRSCYMSMVRTGQARSGKAIVSFTIGADGRTAGLSVEAPAFADTPLPGCVTAQVSHWEFPKSQRGGGTVSYPFVFVGG